MTYKIKRDFTNGPRNPFYLNVCVFHLPRPRLKIRKKGTVDGYPIIHVDTGRCQ